MKKYRIKNLVLSAMFLAVGIVLPLFTMQIKEIGDTLLPMHLAIMLCGLVCGAKYGLVIGFVLPFARSVLFSMPPIYPNAVWMAFELATYGFVIGFLYNKSKSKSVKALYFSLITSMICGRIVWAAAKTILMGLKGKLFTFEMFLTGAFLDAIPGIALQLILIPIIMWAVNKYGNKGVE